MKKISKLLALVLALALCLCMAPAAFAAEATTGTITINNSMTGTTYKAYKIFDATVSDDGKISYLATANQKAWFEGKADNPFTFTALNGGTKYTVIATEGRDVIAFLKAHFSVANGVVETDIVGVDGATPTGFVAGNNARAQISALPYGYYFVTSNTGAVVTITSTNPNATVADKNTTPGWDTPDKGDGGKSIVTDGNKTVDKNTVNIGDTVKFQIAINATNYNGDKLITEYTIDDILDEGFTQTNPSDIKVSVGAKELTLGTDYTISNPTGKTFSINIPWATKGADGKYTFKHTPGVSSAVIKVTYSATLDSDATVGGDEADANKNTADFTWKEIKVDPEDPTKPTDPDPKDPEDDPDPDVTKTYTYSFHLFKTDNENDLLNGAEFELYEAKDVTGGVVSAGATPIKFAQDGSNYRVDPNGNVTTIAVNGQTIISGLKGGTTDTENTVYYLKETKAPDGYNILTTLTPVEVGKANNGTAVASGSKYDEATNKGVAVVNETGNLLPSTGGIGTTIFYVVGGMLALVAVVLLVTKKRMNNMD